MLRTTSLILAAALIAASSTPAFAQTEVSARVSTAGLDLASQRDKRILQLRINRAAASLCDQSNERFGVSVRKAQHACRDEAVRTAMADVEAQSGVTIAAR
jgi:UrcA family protein